ncbi:MAG TPA: transglutaminase family protein [Steroidobacteraceae bacterium]|nr:transglutaminase family protein [Steroidobacteraceae bacterium]
MTRATSRRYRIRHETRYEYAADVVHSHHLLHLVPRPAPYQECLEHDIEITPETHRRANEIDAFGNPLIRLELAAPHRELAVVSTMEIEVHARPAVSAETTDAWEKVRDSFAYRGELMAGYGLSRDHLDAARFRHESPHVRVKQSFTDWSAVCFPEGQPILVCAEQLTAKLQKEIEYVPGVTTIGTSATELLETRKGVCQDFAHLMIACFRSRGLPARYVSGYLRTNAATGEDGRKLVGDGASHAWVAVWSPPYGWLEFDPTNGCFAGTDHVAVAWGRDFGDVSPLRGVILGGDAHKLSVSVAVVPREEATAPSAAD